MRYPYHIRSLPVLLTMILLLVCGGLLALSSPTVAHPGARAPVRLRLKIETSTLRSGNTTRISAEFLDRDYQQVPSDAMRTVEFGIANGYSGSLSPAQITVRPGAWSADTTFASGQPGKVVITARTGGLDPGQAILVVVRPAASFLSQVFETVAYADSFDGFDLFPSTVLEAPANNHGRVTFQIIFNEPPPAGTRIRICVTPPAVLNRDGQNLHTITEVTLADNQASSDYINIVSGTAADVDVKAVILPNGPEKHLSLKFTPPRPDRIIIGEEMPEIGAYKTEAKISVQLADDSSRPLPPDKERRIRLSSEDPVEFDPPTVTLSPEKRFVEAKIRLKGFPITGQLKLLAEYEGGDSIKSGERLIPVRSALEKVTVTGPLHLTRGKTSSELIVHLVDKEGRARVADWDRSISLSATGGSLSAAEVTIPKGQDVAKVRFIPSGSDGKAVIKAESRWLTEGSLEIVLVTALYWLVIFALIGGLVGGVVRLIPAGDKVERVLPRWTTESWQLLGFRIVGSIVSGLFLYLTVKFGISQSMGSPVLPAGLDLGTQLSAFFFGGIGGFAGTIVFDRLTNWFLPGQKQATQAT